VYKKYNFNISAFFGFIVRVERFVQCAWNYKWVTRRSYVVVSDKFHVHLIPT